VPTKEHEVVYLRYARDGEVKAQFVSIEELSPAASIEKSTSLRCIPWSLLQTS